LNTFPLKLYVTLNTFPLKLYVTLNTFHLYLGESRGMKVYQIFPEKGKFYVSIYDNLNCKYDLWVFNATATLNIISVISLAIKFISRGNLLAYMYTIEEKNSNMLQLTSS
jgi:hypothetical protein